MKLYLAGPMRGYRWFNFPAFLEAGHVLNDLGHDVFNPAEHDIAKHGYAAFQVESGDIADVTGVDFDLRHSLGEDLDFIAAEADGVVVLDGWLASSGAKAEVATALALGLPVFVIDTNGYDLVLAEIDPIIRAITTPALAT